MMTVEIVLAIVVVFVLAEGVLLLGLVRHVADLRDQMAFTPSLPSVAPSALQPEQLNLQRIDGNVADFEGLPKGPALVLFVSPACSVCEVIAPVVTTLAERYGARTAVVVNGDVSAAKGWSASHGIEGEVFADPDGAGAKAMGLPGYPYALALDSEGAIVESGAVPTGTALERLMKLAA